MKKMKNEEENEKIERKMKKMKKMKNIKSIKRNILEERPPLTGLFSIRQEIILTPVIILIPVLVSLAFIYSYMQFSNTGNLIIGTTILLGNLIFDIPFLKSFIKVRKSKD